MGLTTVRPGQPTGFGALIAKTCTDKNELKRFLNERPQTDEKFYTPGHPETLCTGDVLSSYQLEKHKSHFCSIRPGHSVCVTPSKPSPSPKPSRSPSRSPSSSPPPSESPSQDETLNQLSSILLFSVISCFSCIISIVLLVFMMKRRQT